jgi:hypothetical protein
MVRNSFKLQTTPRALGKRGAFFFAPTIKAKVEFIMPLLLRKYVVYFNQLNNTPLERA